VEQNVFNFIFHQCFVGTYSLTGESNHYIYRIHMPNTTFMDIFRHMMKMRQRESLYDMTGKAIQRKKREEAWRERFGR
jgi:hypothetical protein